MACAKGCCETQRDHYRSLSTLTAGYLSRTQTTVTRTDENTTVETTEHFDGSRDVKVRVPMVRASTNVLEPKG